MFGGLFIPAFFGLISPFLTHIRGQVTIGAYALDTNSYARWICLDADEQPEWDQLVNLARDLATDQVPAYLELSRRGGHLWLFFEQPIPGVDARRFARQLIQDRGIDDIEIYPRQDELRTGAGSLVRLPLGVHRRDPNKRRFPFVTVDGHKLAETARDHLAILATPLRVPLGFIETNLQNLPLPERVFEISDKTRRKVMALQPSERIKSAISVYDFVSQFVDLDRNGRGYCPFHDDARKSFSVHRERNFWQCFAGCKGQTIIDFYIRWKGLPERVDHDTWEETLKELLAMLNL